MVFIEVHKGFNKRFYLKLFEQVACFIIKEEEIIVA